MDRCGCSGSVGQFSRQELQGLTARKRRTLFLVLALSRPILDAIQRPRDLPAAKARGEDLLSFRGKTVLVITAHPDDAEWWVGGTLAGLSGQGNRVILVLGTSGEQGANVPNLGAIREDEQQQAAKILGYTEVIFLRHPDRQLSQSTDFPQELKDLYRQVSPDAVITFDIANEGYIYHHEDHRAAGRAAWEAAKDQPNLAFYLFHSSAPNVLVNYAPVKEQKKEALTILQGYQPSDFWHSILKIFAGGENYGGRAVYSEVGVQWGELLRFTPRGAP
jgi:LmbE family N-acetylglucosaminyl deacetylase